MSPANATSSPRDDDVDANPDLARKKQRLSEDQDDESAADDAVPVEACEPEDIGGAPGNAIEIEDDETGMAPYSDVFWLRGPGTPADQINLFAHEIASGKYYFRVDDFVALASGIWKHCEDTKNHSEEQWREQYLSHDYEFFSRLANLACLMLSTYDLFDSPEMSRTGMRSAMQEFFVGLATLSGRIIPMLPDIINATLSRRDSALQGSAVLHPVDLVQYLGVAVRSIPNLSDLARSFVRHARVDTTATQTANMHALSQPAVLTALGAMPKLLGGAMRQIKDSWIILQDTLRLFHHILSNRQYHRYPGSLFEEIMEVVKACILPAVCAKHPGALPDGFHNELVNLGHLSLFSFAQENSHSDTCKAYLRFVKSDEDAILQEGIQDNDISEMLAKVSDDDSRLLGQLLAASWAMQASIAYVRSDIMNIRSLGLNNLSTQLQSAFDFAKKVGDFDHVCVQHAVRFLRKNEVTKYIFSSDSHASLVSESSVVILFLSATATYTDQETDVIWRACSTSVEADFVKASFGVLSYQLPNLDFSHTLYILRKYQTTPISNLGAAAVEFLPEVLQRLNEFHGSSFESANRRELAFTTIDILKHVDASDPSVSSGRLRSILHVEIAKFVSREYTTHDRREIYTRIVPDIERHTSDGTTAAEVLTILLRLRLPLEDTRTILAMLPVSVAVEDLQCFVADRSHLPESDFPINAIILRLSYIMSLMSFDKDGLNDETVRRMFDSVFGEHALGVAARGAAWDKLHSLTAMKDGPPAAIHLWRIYMQRYVPSLPTTLASPRLVELIWTYLKEECAAGEIGSDYTQLLRHPLWEALGRFATMARDSLVVDAAASALMHFLFDYPARPGTRDLRKSAVKCQQESVRAHARTLQQQYTQLRGEDTSTEEQDVFRIVNLLHGFLVRSREFTGFYAGAHQQDVVVLEPTADEADRLAFSIQIYGADSQPQTLSVQASKTTTVSQLLSSLPSKTGAAANRIIAAGREITGLTMETLEEAGVRDSSLIQIRPRYKQDFNFDHLLMRAGPVEKEIVAHFDILERLMDGPLLLAEKAMNFLRIIPPTSKARQHVASPSATVEELFPRHRPARAQFSVYVLDWHLRDCARLGIGDTQFLARGTRLLTSVLMDKARALLEPITLEVVNCLHAFLQERPASDEARFFFDDGASFATRMVDRLFEIERAARTNFEMGPIASNAYETLLLAVHMDSMAWQCLSTSEQSTRLHARLLLHPDPRFSEGIARPIRSLCQNHETPKSISEFFWSSLMACLPKALANPTKSLVFFNLVSEVIHTVEWIQSSETEARNMVEQLSTALWGYNHAESVDALLRDDAMVGLLRVLREAVTILRSFKKPLQVEGLPSRITEQLLFPDSSAPDYRPIIHHETRAVAYDLVRLTLESGADFERIVEATEKITEKSVRQPGARFPGPPEWRREPGECSGLTNLGMTCYMNSMLQQLFGNIQFRKFVLDVPVQYPEKQYLLQQVQSLFARMQSDIQVWQDTNSLAHALGVQVGNQEDVHDFYASLLSRLEDEMPDTDSKVALSRFFTGQSITQIRGECGHVSSQNEAFGDLSVTVKNKPTLHDSLAEFVQGEPMEGSNKYKCMSCDPENGRLVDAMRRTCLEEVPDCLTVCLKRFTFGSKFLGEGKVNDRFDFPETVDMSLYKRSHLEAPNEPHDPDVFQLVGVIVHQGSLNLGHYWSYIRVPDPARPGSGNWYHLEDQKTSFCPTGFDVIQQECFGGQRYSNGNERPDNAYVLFYQRTQYAAEASVACDGSIGLPKVVLQAPLADDISSANAWRQRIDALFNPNFASHVCWLLNQYPAFKDAKASASDTESSPGSSEHSDDGFSGGHEAKVGALMAHYALRILASDPECGDKLSQTIPAFKTALAADSKLCRHILDVFCFDEFAFEAVHCCDNAGVRRAVMNLLTNCISTLRERDHAAYMRTVDQLLYWHNTVRGKTQSFDKHHRSMNDYFSFASFIAGRGLEETKMVLDHGYLTGVFELIYLPKSKPAQQAHQLLWGIMQRDSSAVDFDPLFHFLYNLFSDHVDLTDLWAPDQDADDRARTSQGWLLRGRERNWLLRQETQDRGRTWSIFMFSSWRCATEDKDWQEWGFGKFLGLMVSDNVDPRFKALIADTLLVRYDEEETHLDPLLYATLHYCASSEDDECRALLRGLGKNLSVWHAERKCLSFLTEAFALAPRSVLASAETWGSEFLTCKRESSRQATGNWLKKHVLVEEPLSEDRGLDCHRVRVARLLAKALCPAAKAAYDQEKSKNHWEAAMEVLQTIASFISSLMDAIAIAHEESRTLPNELLVESDEARAVLQGVSGVLHDLEDWESEMTLPTRSVGIRRSVEFDETDDLVSDDDEELEDVDSQEL